MSQVVTHMCTSEPNEAFIGHLVALCPLNIILPIVSALLSQQSKCEIPLPSCQGVAPAHPWIVL